MTRAELAAWIAGYERAWRAAGTDSLRELFTPDATYRASPFIDPLTGLDEIASFWESEREGVSRLAVSGLAAQGREAP